MAQERLHRADVGARRERSRRGRVAKIVWAKTMDFGARLDGFELLVNGDDRLAKPASCENIIAALDARRGLEDTGGRLGQIDLALPRLTGDRHAALWQVHGVPFQGPHLTRPKATEQR